MSINKAEKRTAGTALVAAAVFCVMALLDGGWSVRFDFRTFLLLHAVLESVTFAVAISIQLLGWMFFVRTMSSHRLYTAGLFTIVGMLDLAHALTFYGMPFFREAGVSVYTVLYGGLGQLIAAVGLLLILRRDDRLLPGVKRGKHAALFVSAGTAAVAAVPLGDRLGWFGDAAMHALRAAYPVVTLGGCLAAIAILLYRNRSERPQALLTIVQGLIWLFFANAQLYLTHGETDYAGQLLGQAFKLAGYYFLLWGIYYVTIEEPLKERKRAEARARHMAYHDELTGLGNRRLLSERLTAEIGKAAGAGCRFGLMLLDIDRFKTINDSLGHTAGDRLIAEAARRLVRSAPASAQVFRMGGDEFMIVAPTVRSGSDAAAAAETIMAAFGEPVRLGGRDFHITISLGIAVYPEDGGTVDDLVRNADVAMYAAKADRNAYRVYAGDMSFRADERLRLENDMRKALEREEFVLDYQPLVELASERVVGVEALVRWKHPERGLVQPGEFIPLAEENGFIVQLGEWVMRTACRQNKAWQDAGLPPIVVSVNLSPRQFRQQELPDRVEAVLAETGLAPAYLELEITESMTANVDFARRALARLKAIGVRISIDDFGTGYSTLFYLKTFPIDKLKIDKSFVTDLAPGGNDAAIVTTIAMIARHMNLKVTAEGVENAGQLAFLKDQRCEEGQGYYFARPIPADDFAAWYEGASSAV